jgi:hypothetical protein
MIRGRGIELGSRRREWSVVDEDYGEHLRQVQNPGRTIDAVSSCGYGARN